MLFACTYKNPNTLTNTPLLYARRPRRTDNQTYKTWTVPLHFRPIRALMPFIKSQTHNMYLIIRTQYLQGEENRYKKGEREHATNTLQTEYSIVFPGIPEITQPLL